MRAESDNEAACRGSRFQARHVAKRFSSSQPLTWMAATPGENIQIDGAAIPIGEGQQHVLAVRTPTTLDCFPRARVWRQI
jgi:hypothetical protein